MKASCEMLLATDLLLAKTLAQHMDIKRSAVCISEEHSFCQPRYMLFTPKQLEPQW